MAKNRNQRMVYILDIDGTLMPSGEIDNRCYWQAIAEVFGVTVSPPDLHSFRHVTDTGILREWHQRQFGSEPDIGASRAVMDRFLEITRRAIEDEPACFKPLAGVDQWIRSNLKQGNPMALATGGWRCTASLKLRVSGLDRHDLPLASSDDASSRTAIMLTALSRIEDHLQQSFHALSIRYIGDGTWDLEASQRLGWGFIGIARGTQRRRLLNKGALWVEPDFRGLVPNDGRSPQ